MQESQINSLNEDELMNFITNEIFQSLNSCRDMFNATKFYRDDAAELAVKDYFFLACSNEDQLNQQLLEVEKIFFKF